MKIIEIVSRADQDSFETIMRVTLDLPADVFSDGTRLLLGRSELASIIGQGFVDAMKEYKNSL